MAAYPTTPRSQSVPGVCCSVTHAVTSEQRNGLLKDSCNAVNTQKERNEVSLRTECDNAPKIFIDRFAEPDICYGEETLCLTKKDEIFSLYPKGCKKYNKNGILQFKLQDKLVQHPIDVATWSNGQILMSDSGECLGDGKILLFNNNGNLSKILVSGLTSPVGIATDSYNNIYVCDKTDNCLLKFNEFGYFVHVLKRFNVPTFVRTVLNGDIIISDADGIYCLGEKGTLKWKHKLITACNFCALDCGCVLIDHEHPSNIPGQPVVSLVGKHNEDFITKSIIGATGIYIDSEENIWVGIASQRYFRQLQFNHRHTGSMCCRSSTTKIPKIVSDASSLSRGIRSSSTAFLDCSFMSRCNMLKSLKKDPYFEIIFDKRLDNVQSKLMSAHQMREHNISACFGQNRHIYSLDNAMPLTDFIDLFIHSQKTILSQRDIEDLILHDVELDSPSSLDNAVLSIIDCKTDTFENLLILHNLLSKGANVNSKDFSGNTALHKAVMCKKELHVRLLLSYGADPSATKDRGDSPLSLSVLYSQTDSTKAMAWCLSRFFYQTHVHRSSSLYVWPGYNPDTIKLFQTARTRQKTVDYTFSSHLKNQRDICHQMLKHANVLKKKETVHDDEQGIYVVSQTDRNYVEETESFRGIKIIWRRHYDVSPEATHLGSKGKLRINKISDDVSKTIISMMELEAPKLFSDHTNLTIINPSGVKSIGFETGKHKIMPSICISLYCKVKGIIPMGENPFPKNIGPFPTDVREGYFTLGNGIGGPNDYHDKLKIGCCISADNGVTSGTLGGFVQKENDTYFVTAAHVLFDCRALSNLSTYLKFSPVHVLQPTKSSSNNNLNIKAVGKVTKAVFNHGRHNTVSIDAALIRITDTDRSPVDGSVPGEKQEKLLAAGYDLSNLPTFTSGQILETITEDQRRHDVVKYGAESGLTRGALNVDGTHVRIENKELRIIETSFGVKKEVRFTMYNQREVMNIGDRNFFQLGDSGAFVFMPIKDEDPKCIGMAIGRTSYGSCIMTPIANVLHSLGLQSPFKLKSFPRIHQSKPISPKPKLKQNQSMHKKKQTTMLRQSKRIASQTTSSQFIPSVSGFNPIPRNSKTTENNSELVDVLKSIDTRLEQIEKKSENHDKRLSEVEKSKDNSFIVSQILEAMDRKFDHERENSKGHHFSMKNLASSKRKSSEFSASPSPPKKPSKDSVVKTPQSLQSLIPDTPNDVDYEFDLSSVDFLNTPLLSADAD